MRVTRRVLIFSALFTLGTQPLAKAAPKRTDFVTFTEERPPSGMPPGVRAIRFVLPGVVYTGTAARFTMKGNAFSIGGSELQTRPSSKPNESSLVFIPTTVLMPASVKRLRH